MKYSECIWNGWKSSANKISHVSLLQNDKALLKDITELLLAYEVARYLTRFYHQEKTNWPIFKKNSHTTSDIKIDYQSNVLWVKESNE